MSDNETETARRLLSAALQQDPPAQATPIEQVPIQQGPIVFNGSVTIKQLVQNFTR